MANMFSFLSEKKFLKTEKATLKGFGGCKARRGTSESVFLSVFHKIILFNSEGFFFFCGFEKSLTFLKELSSGFEKIPYMMGRLRKREKSFPDNAFKWVSERGKCWQPV